MINRGHHAPDHGLDDKPRAGQRWPQGSCGVSAGSGLEPDVRRSSVLAPQGTKTFKSRAGETFARSKLKTRDELLAERPLRHTVRGPLRIESGRRG